MRILGVNLKDGQHVAIALTAIYGVGRSISLKICQEVGLNPSVPLGSLNDEQVKAIRNYLQLLKVEGDLRRETSLNIKRLVDIKSYRGRRHRFSLPLNGQRTRSNARTARKSRSKLTK